MVLVCLPSDALLQHLPSYLGFSYLGRGVSLHPLLLTLDEGYLLMAAPPDLECGVAPLGPPAPVQPPLLGRRVAPSGHCPWPWTWLSLKSILCLRETRTGQSSSKVLTCSHFSVCVCTHLCPTHDPVDQSLPGFSVEFSRQEHWKKLLFPIPVNLLDSRIEILSLSSPALAGRLLTTGASQEALYFRAEFS